MAHLVNNLRIPVYNFRHPIVFFAEVSPIFSELKEIRVSDRFGAMNCKLQWLGTHNARRRAVNLRRKDNRTIGIHEAI